MKTFEQKLARTALYLIRQRKRSFNMESYAIDNIGKSLFPKDVICATSCCALGMMGLLFPPEKQKYYSWSNYLKSLLEKSHEVQELDRAHELLFDSDHPSDPYLFAERARLWIEGERDPELFFFCRRIRKDTLKFLKDVWNS